LATITVADPGCLFLILGQDFFPSRIPDPGSKISDPGSNKKVEGKNKLGIPSSLTKQANQKVATKFTKYKRYLKQVMTGLPYIINNFF
jgi:hypothetical protein